MIHANTLQYLEYTFLDSEQHSLDISTYLSATLHVKLQNSDATEVSGSMTTPSQGIVSANYSFASPGSWSLQFSVINGLGNKLYGDILRITVSPNLDD